MLDPFKVEERTIARTRCSFAPQGEIIGVLYDMKRVIYDASRFLFFEGLGFGKTISATNPNLSPSNRGSTFYRSQLQNKSKSL
jgi:hypothetical protein